MARLRALAVAVLLTSAGCYASYDDTPLANPTPPGPPLGVEHRLTESCSRPHAALVACYALASLAGSTVELGVDWDSSPKAQLSVVSGHPTYTATLSFRERYVDNVVGGLEVALLPYGEWRRLTPPSRRKIIDPITVDYEGVKHAARGVDLRVQLSYDNVGEGRIGTTTMQVTMRAPAI